MYMPKGPGAALGHHFSQREWRGSTCRGRVRQGGNASLEKRISCQAGEGPSNSWAFRASCEYGDLTGEEEHDGVEL
jgi:hypothetical protein